MNDFVIEDPAQVKGDADCIHARAVNVQPVRNSVLAVTW